MNENERDTHFKGFAKLQMPELDSLFVMLYQAYATGNTAKRDEYSQRIETYLAQRAYDIGEHVFNHITEAMTHFDSFEVLVEENEIPDLTEWPKNPPQEP